VIHGLTKYFNGDVAPELKGKVLARMGDQTEVSEPFVLAMPEQSTWEWKAANICTDAIAWGGFADKLDNRNKLWVPPAAPTTTINLPRLLSIPAIVAKFLTEQEHTAYEAYKYVLALVVEDESGVTLEDAVLLTSWFMAAGQSTGSTETQAIPLEFQPVTSIDAAFQKWAFNQATHYLGEKPKAKGAPAAQNNLATNTVLGAESILMGVITVLQNIAGRIQDRALLEATKKSEESKPYDECDSAALMGYCGVKSADDVPALWPQLKQTKKPVDQ
jgi:hypothetical protein